MFFNKRFLKYNDGRCVYHLPIFTVFITGSIFYGLWIWIFLKKRRLFDYKIFEQQGMNRNVVYQLITGMQEIKLQSCACTRLGRSLPYCPPCPSQRDYYHDNILFDGDRLFLVDLDLY